MTKIALLLPTDFFAGGATGMLDILLLANRLASRSSDNGFDWKLLSENGEPARSSTGITLSVDGSYKDGDESDLILLPGILYRDIPSFEQRLVDEAPLLDHLRRWHGEGKLIAANCTSVSLLAESGLLDGQQATICWWLSAWFRNRFPSIDLHTHAMICESPGLLCSGATTAYLDLALRLVERLAGTDLALACARTMLVDTNRASQAPYATLQQYSGHRDALIECCQHWLQENMDRPFRLDAMAAAMATSERTLIRRFRDVLGDTPLHYLQQLRLFAARRMLENSTLGLEEIVSRVGYADVSAFRRLFKRELRCAPGEYRRRFSANPRMTDANSD